MTTTENAGRMYTVVTKKRVIRARAKSLQHITQALNSVGIKFLSVWEDAK